MSPPEPRRLSDRFNHQRPHGALTGAATMNAQPSAIPSPASPEGGASDLTLRQHQRVRCSIACPLRVAPEHAKMVQLSSIAADASGGFEGTLVDLSRGGAGVRTSVFVPKQTRLIVRLPDAGGTLSLTLRVMRVQMIDRTPRYELGLALVDATPELVSAVGAMIEAVAREQEAAREAGQQPSQQDSQQGERIVGQIKPGAAATQHNAGAPRG